MKKFYAATLLLVLSITYVFGQSGSLQGKVTDAANGKPMGYVAVVALQNGVQKGGSYTDDNGNYTIKPLNPGTYVIKSNFAGFQASQIEVVVTGDNLTFQDIQMSTKATTLNEITITANKLIDPGKITTGTTFSREALEKISTDGNNVNYIVSTSAGVIQKENGGGISIGGARGYSNKYYVDGIPSTGSLSSKMIDQISIITGGLPARYGDATGGVINITTRGPSATYGGGAEFTTSKFLDPRGFSRVAINLSGPVLTKYKKTDTADARIGFIVSAEYSRSEDGSPNTLGAYKVKDDVLQSLRENPLQPAKIGAGFVPRAAFITMNDLEKIDASQNTKSQSIVFNGKLDFKLTNYSNLILFGGVDLSESHGYNEATQLFSANTNGYGRGGTFRGYIKYTQRFASGNNKGGKTATFQNAYYSLQAGYTKSISESYDKRIGKNIMDYGYLGKFKTYKMPRYVSGKDSVLDLYSTHVFTGYVDTLVTYTPSNLNPDLSAYTSDYYKLTGSTPIDGTYGINGNHGYYRSLTTIAANGGLVNGQGPASIYSMWSPTGTSQSGISKGNSSVYFLSFNGSVDIVSTRSNKETNRHAIEFGFEYEQQNNTSWSVSPYGLWTLARQLVNSHLILDKEHPIIRTAPDGTFLDTITYNFAPLGRQSYLDYNLRKKIGASSSEIIDIDNLDPSVFTIDMFSPDELLNNGGSFIGYAGYDWKGDRLKNQPSFFDFFNKQETIDGKTINTRPIGASRPIYAAAYIQDKFNFKDLIFNIGIRVDRYDANQKTLKDLYSLWPIRTAGEVKGQFEIPGNVPDNYYVYVNNAEDPTQILGFRDKDTWYDASGSPVADPKLIAQSTSSGIIAPYLESPFNKNSPITEDGFKDYEPKLTVMPRISFSFPISDQALFFAHYDVLTQRPGQNQTSPYNYYYFRQISVNSIMANPSLAPERTIDYEVGFKQALSKFSALTISGNYRELKDMVQVRKILYAVPIDYTTFGNIDFGTVKSLKLTYQLTRPKNKNISLEINYTLQFAEGTGSSQGSQINLINSGSPNLRQILPFDYDQRHTINAIVDYRYGDDNYNGPIIAGKKILKNTGLNTIIRVGSGTPYSQQLTPTPTQLGGVVTQTSLKGNINGSRLPYTFKIDLRLDRDFTITTKKGTKGEEAKAIFVNAYFLVENVLNTKNVLGVHRYTGSATDDGYLSSTQGQQALVDQLNPQSFIDLYHIKLLDNAGYSRPRLMRIGLSLNF